MNPQIKSLLHYHCAIGAVWSSMTDSDRRYLVGNEKYYHYTNRAYVGDSGGNRTPHSWCCRPEPKPFNHRILASLEGFEPSVSRFVAGYSNSVELQRYVFFVLEYEFGGPYGIRTRVLFRDREACKTSTPTVHFGGELGTRTLNSVTCCLFSRQVPHLAGCSPFWQRIRDLNP